MKAAIKNSSWSLPQAQEVSFVKDELQTLALEHI